MGQVNQPSNLLDRIKRFERELQRLWKAVGLASATITQGGLTLLQDAFLRMVDDNDDEIVYIGPDADGKQIFRLRREGGATMMFTAGSEVFGRDFWSWTDSHGTGIVSDDAETGIGMARPWLPVVLYPKFGIADTGAVYAYAGIYAENLSGETTLWEGRASIQHPWIVVDGVWGRGSGSGQQTYRLYVADELVGEWADDNAGAPSAFHTDRFDVSKWVLTDWASIRLTVTADGTGIVACQVLGCYLL